MKPKITLISRLRNEELLLPDFLNHLDPFINEAFFFDDCSQDSSYEILRAYPKTKFIIRNNFHSRDQQFIQTTQRHLLLELVKKNTSNDFLLLAEPDEHIEFNFDKLEEYDKQGVNGIFFKLFDAYLTPKDKAPYKKRQKLWNFRKYFGPEMREIGFLFRKDKAKYDLTMPGQRQPNIIGKTIVDGYVQHYGKAMSVKDWEEKCDYYIHSMPMLSKKWQDRKGKAIKKDYKSDFGRKLLMWDDIISGESSIVKI